MKNLRMWLVSATVVALGAACTDVDESALTPMPSTPAPPYSPPAPATVDPGVELLSLTWEVAFGPRSDGLIVQDIDRGRVLYDHFGDVDGTTELVRVGHDSTSEGTTLPLDRRIQQAEFLGTDVIFSVTADADPAVFEILWWPAGGAEPVMVWDAVAEGSEYSEFVVHEALLYFVRTVDDAMCLVEEGMETDRLEIHQDVACGGPGEVLWWLRGGHDGTVFYLLSPSMSDDCSQMYRWVARHDAPELITTDGCVSRGAATADTAVWSTAPPLGSGGTVDWSAAELFVLRTDERVSLGRGSAGSLIPCGEAVYWTVDPTEGTAAEIRSWTRSDGVHAVFRSGRDSAGWDDFSLSRPACMDGMVGFHRIDTSGNFSVEYVTAAP